MFTKSRLTTVAMTLVAIAAINKLVPVARNPLK